MLCAVPGLGAGALTVVVVELDELDAAFAAAFSEATTCEGFTFAGLDATERVPTAASMTMVFCRSCTINATEPLRGSESMASARLFAPRPVWFIALAVMATAATRITARKNAGSTILRRRRSLRDLRDLGDLLAEVRDALALPVEAGFAASSVAVRFGDNAVPSACCGAPSIAADPQCQKGSSPVRNFARTSCETYTPFRDANHSLITRSVTCICGLQEARRYE